MVMTVRGLSGDDIAEVVDCLLLGSAAVAESAPDLSARRQELANELGDALDELPQHLGAR